MGAADKQPQPVRAGRGAGGASCAPDARGRVERVGSGGGSAVRTRRTHCWSVGGALDPGAEGEGEEVTVLYRHTSLLGHQGDGTIPHRPPWASVSPSVARDWREKDGVVAKTAKLLRSSRLSVPSP